MPEPTNEAWAQIRYEYEHTERPVEEICAEHRISSATLRDRMRRWGWTRRRVPIPQQGPPPVAAPPVETATSLPSAPLPDWPQAESATPSPALAPPGAADDGTGALDETAILLRLQGAVARLLPAVEGTVAKLGAGSLRPREMESGVRALATLTRTLRELNGLLERRRAAARDIDDDIPEDMDEFRNELARRINAFVDSHWAEQ